MTTRVPILTFHALDDRGGIIACPARVFARGIERLLDAGFHALTLTGIVERIRRGAALPERRFALSFDDGYRSVYDEARPVLARHEIPATLFVSVGAGDTAASDRRADWKGRAMLSWSQIRALHESGFEVAAHTLTHPDLTRLSASEVEAEMVGSQAAIEARIGVPVRGFSYPYGRFDAAARAIASRHFDYAVSDRLACVTAASDVYALERVEIFYFRGAWRIGLLSHRALPLYLAALNLPRSLRRSVLRGRH